MSYSQGSEMARKIKAYRYVECSALTQHGLKNAVENAIRAVLDAPAHSSNDRSPLLGARGGAAGCCSCVVL